MTALREDDRRLVERLRREHPDLVLDPQVDDKGALVVDVAPRPDAGWSRVVRARLSQHGEWVEIEADGLHAHGLATWYGDDERFHDDLSEMAGLLLSGVEGLGRIPDGSPRLVPDAGGFVPVRVGTERVLFCTSWSHGHVEWETPGVRWRPAPLDAGALRTADVETVLRSGRAVLGRAEIDGAGHCPVLVGAERTHRGTPLLRRLRRRRTPPVIRYDVEHAAPGGGTGHVYLATGELGRWLAQARFVECASDAERAALVREHFPAVPVEAWSRLAGGD